MVNMIVSSMLERSSVGGLSLGRGHTAIFTRVSTSSATDCMLGRKRFRGSLTVHVIECIFRLVRCLRGVNYHDRRGDLVVAVERCVGRRMIISVP